MSLNNDDFSGFDSPKYVSKNTTPLQLDLTVTYEKNYKVIPVGSDINLYHIQQLIYQSFRINRRLKISLFNHKYDLLDYSNQKEQLYKYKFIAVSNFNIFHCKLSTLSKISFQQDTYSLNKIMQTCSSNYNLQKTFFKNYFNLDQVFKLQFKSLYEGFIIAEHNFKIQVGQGRNQTVSNEIQEQSPVTLEWKLLSSPSVRPSPRYNQVWMKSKNIVQIYGGKNMRGHHLSDIWSLDLDKLDQFQKEKIILDNTTSSDKMKVAQDINQKKEVKSSLIKAIGNATNQPPNVSFSSLNKKNPINPIKKIIYDMNKQLELIPIEDDLNIAKNFIGVNDQIHGIHLDRTNYINKEKFGVMFSNQRQFRNISFASRMMSDSVNREKVISTFEYNYYIKRISKNIKQSIQINSINAITDLQLELEKLMILENPNVFPQKRDENRQLNIFKDMANFQQIYKRINKELLAQNALLQIKKLFGKTENESSPYLKLPMHDEEFIDGALMCSDGNKFLQVYGGQSHTYTQFSDRIKQYDIKSNVFRELNCKVKGRRQHIFSYLKQKLYAGFGKRNYPLNDLNIVELNKQTVQTVEFDPNLDQISLNCVNKMQNEKQNVMIFGGEDGIVISIIAPGNMRVKRENCLVAQNDKFIDKNPRQLFQFHGNLWVRAELTDYENKMLFSITESEM